MDAAQAAQAAGDYRTAATQVRSAWMLVCGLPDSDLVGERMRWDREALERMADHLQRLAATQPAADPHRPVGVMTATEVIYLRG